MTTGPTTFTWLQLSACSSNLSFSQEVMINKFLQVFIILKTINEKKKKKKNYNNNSKPLRFEIHAMQNLHGIIL